MDLRLTEASLKRLLTSLQILTEVLNSVTSEERIDGFLQGAIAGPLLHPFSSNKVLEPRVSRVDMNKQAQPGGTLYKRFLKAMGGHVADLGGMSVRHVTVEVNDRKQLREERLHRKSA